MSGTDRTRDSLLIRDVRIVPVAAAAPEHRQKVDIRVAGGTVREVAPGLAAEPHEQVLDADGRWAIPGLWDQHVHMLEWAQARARLDVSSANGPAEVTAMIRQHVAALPAERRGELVLGGGFRLALWDDPPTVRALDAASGEHPVILTSGDGHAGWLNSIALKLLGAPPRDTALTESEWFALASRIDDLPGMKDGFEPELLRVVQDAAARGVVGIVDFDLRDAHTAWPVRIGQGVDQLRVRTAVYPGSLDDVIAAGLRTGDPVSGGHGLVTMGPLKIIGDGSLSTRTAHCCEPYVGAGSASRGAANFSFEALHDLLARAHAHGLEVAVHAIGDAAGTTALDAFAATGAAGSIEHAQLMRRNDVQRMATLAVRASVQPAHLIDDRDMVEHCWPDRADRCFMFATMRDAGVPIVLGSDAPVAPLDPWSAMAAAVHRSGDSRPAWNQRESLTPAEALAASTDGQGTLAPGSRGDIALLDHDPLPHSDEDTAAAAAHLRGMTVDATILAGRITYLAR